MKKKFNIKKHVLSHADYVNNNGFNDKLSHNHLRQFVISFHDLQFLDREKSSLEILSRIADEIKTSPVVWKEFKKLKNGTKKYIRFGRTEDCLVVVHEHPDHPHIHFIFSEKQLNKKRTKLIKRGFGPKFHLLKCFIKKICDRYGVEPNFYLTALERQAFRNPEIDSKLKKTLSQLSWQMKQNPHSEINYSKEHILEMLETYINQSGNVSFINKFIRLWNKTQCETQDNILPPFLPERDISLLEILEENDSEKLLSSIDEKNYRSIILNDLIRFLYGKMTNLLHELTDLSALRYPKSVAKKILDIKDRINKEIRDRLKDKPVRPSVSGVFNKALSHVMKHSKSFDDIEKNMKYYFEDFGFAGIPYKKVDKFIPVMDHTWYCIAIKKTPYKKNRYIRQRLIKNTLNNVASFRPLRSIKKQIDILKGESTTKSFSASPRQSISSDLNM